MQHSSKFNKSLLSLTIAAVLAAGAVQADPRSWTRVRSFSMDNLIGDSNGTMLGTLGNGSDDTIVCGASALYPLSPDCPTALIDGQEQPQTMAGDEATVLYPIDSTFGFNVVPFALAVDKVRDGYYGEGWVGNVMDGTEVIGIEFSDAETDTFLVPAGMGTWCTGLGGASVKCSTEHFTVLEHVLTCHETIPYYNADPYGDPNDPDAAQLQILDPTDGVTVLVDCADTKLDNNLRVLNSETDVPGLLPSDIDGLMVGADAYDPQTGDDILAINWVALFGTADPDEVLSFLEPNESTILDDIAYGDDYSMTAKDDGKPLYRWGNLIKRPNDIRVYTRIPVPKLWRDPATVQSINGGNGYRVTKAHLTIRHKVTNNPNDQIRPEDMENEAAIGRLPGYTVSSNKWLSDKDCYQGNGIYIPMGTVLRNGDFAIPDTNVSTHVWDNNPYAWSKDLREGLTNGYYTTVDREPFEWSYDSDLDADGVSDSFRTPQDPAPGTLLSGPRWRLTPPKFGQDIPGLEIPVDNCAPPPYQKAMIKYEVGLPVTTVIDMLDWNPDDERSINGESPLVWSRGWTSAGAFNDGTVVNPDVVIDPSASIMNVTVNGSPVTKGFDLSIYIKGDRKPTALYDATLDIEWDDSTNWTP